MRRIVLSTLLFLLLSLSAVAQNEGINFQGMARNAAGEALANQKISLRLSVLLNSESGTVEYSETKEVTTSGQGIFSVVVGDGNILTNTGNFSDINWKNSPKFLKVELDPSGGTNFTLMGTSKLQAVPFAYYANGVDAENIQGTLPVAKGGTGVGSITALKTSLGIDQVNNTADANKPISTATQGALNTKVDKVTGKELSSNDFTTAEKTKLAAITGTNTGDQDLSGLATTAALATKANTADVTTSLAGKVDKVTGKELSTNDFTTAEKNKLAAITGTNTGDQDLSGYATTAALATKANTADVTTSLAGKVDKVTGKELSSNDFTTAEKTKLAAITGSNTGDQDLSGYATTAALDTKANASDVTTRLAGKVDKVTGKELSTNDFTTAEKTKLAAITGTNTGDQDLSGYATTAALATKANTADVTTSLAGKVDKVTGKELSSNDYTTAEKTKLAAITGTNTGDQTTITGNAGTATKLAAPKNINGVAFDGSADITVSAAAGTLTGATLNSSVTTSSLTSVGILTDLTVTNPINGSITGNAATASRASTVTTNANLTGPVTSIGNATTLSPGAVTTAIIADGAVTNAKVTDVAANKITGTIAVANGGTGQTTFSNGQLLIGNSSNSLTKATLTAGTGISVTNGNGSITITNTAVVVPSGTSTGDMLYWNGSAWVRVPAGSNNKFLTFVNGVPTWTPLISSTDVFNPQTGKVWMDRNLGATQVAISSNDTNSFGDLYQWGRSQDGHQLRNSSTTSSLSSTDTPGNSFILNLGDWRNPSNNSLWQGVNGTNNPCPTGYRIPTESEWFAELNTWSSLDPIGAFSSLLKLPLAGFRYPNDGSLSNGRGNYWSSTINGNDGAKRLYLGVTGFETASLNSYYRATGFSVRCIKD